MNGTREGAGNRAIMGSWLGRCSDNRGAVTEAKKARRVTSRRVGKALCREEV
jgi:hypothetical protein